MSNKADDNGSGGRNSRIDLSRIGDDAWSKSFAGNPAFPGPRKKPVEPMPIKAGQRLSLDDVFESRVHAATARRAVKQNRGQARIWLFAGGLFLAGAGGFAAAYYLVGPPMALSSYGSNGPDAGHAPIASLETGSSLVAPSSPHNQGVILSATASVVPVYPADDVSDAPVSLLPAAGSSETMTVETDSERMVQVVPVAVSAHIETKSNVNVAKASTMPDTSVGQWLALPAEVKPSAPSTAIAAAEQRSTKLNNPAAEPVEAQQEMFRSFQDYLESSGRTATISDPGQEALFNKFIRWSVETRNGN